MRIVQATTTEPRAWAGSWGSHRLADVELQKIGVALADPDRRIRRRRHRKLCSSAAAGHGRGLFVDMGLLDTQGLSVLANQGQ